MYILCSTYSTYIDPSHVIPKLCDNTFVRNAPVPTKPEITRIVCTCIRVYPIYTCTCTKTIWEWILTSPHIRYRIALAGDTITDLR